MNNFYSENQENSAKIPGETSSGSISDQIDTQLRELFADTEFDVENITVKYLPDKSYRLQICLDKDTAVTALDLAALHEEYRVDFERIISGVTENAEYEVDLCSRGITTPLSHYRHWSRNIGRKVSISFTDKTQVNGRIGLLSADKTHITIIFADKSRLSKKNYLLSDIAHAVLDVDFREPNPKIIEYCHQKNDS